MSSLMIITSTRYVRLTESCNALNPLDFLRCSGESSHCCLAEGGLSIPVFHRAFFFSQSHSRENLCLLDRSALDFLGELGRWLSAATGGVCETAFLFQRLSVVIQCYNSVLI